MNGIREKIRESFISVLPVTAIVFVLCFTVFPVSTDCMLSFLIGAVCLIFGLGLFTYGADNSMTKAGNAIGAHLTKSRKLGLILGVSFIIGVIITMAEPDLQVLSDNVPHINSFVLIITVAIGVGFFLVVSMLRIFFGIPIRILLLISYAVVFMLAFFSDFNYLSVAFDSGGVTTGPMTSPFIMSLGIGVAAIRNDKNAEADSFGLVALCSIGPILAVLILGFFYPGESSMISSAVTARYANTSELGFGYVSALPIYLAECAIALAPVVAFFLIFQVAALRLHKVPFTRIMIGILFTYGGLVLFLTGVNVGFSSMGNILGQEIAGGSLKYIIIPVGAVIGWFIVTAEPAVHILTKQVEQISAGAVSAKSMKVSLSIAISLAVAVSMLRILFGIPILYFLIPGYAFALILTFVVPPIFTSIAFDAGGVASGPMTATFLLPFAMGACSAIGGNILTDAFGTVAMIAMFPLITVQLMGVTYVLRTRKTVPEDLPEYEDQEIIELWELGRQ